MPVVLEVWGGFSSRIGHSHIAASLFCSVPALFHRKEQKHFSPEPSIQHIAGAQLSKGTVI